MTGFFTIIRNQKNSFSTIHPGRLFHINGPAALQWIVIIFLLGGVCSAAKYQTSEDFQDARKRVEQGDDVSKEIYKNYAKIPPEFKLEAVDLAAASSSKKAGKYLYKILDKYEEDSPEVKRKIGEHLLRMEYTDSYPLIRELLKNDKMLMNDSIAQHLMKEIINGNAEILFKGLDAGQISYTPELIEYFKKLKFISAIPYFLKALDEGSFPMETMGALVLMRNEAGDSFVQNYFAILSDRNHPYRIFAMRNLKEGFPPEKTAPIVKNVFKFRESEDAEIVIAALETAKAFQYEKNLMAQIKEIYIYDEREGVKKAAMEAGAKILFVSEKRFAEDMAMPLADHQSRMAFLKDGGRDADDAFLLDADLPSVNEKAVAREDGGGPGRIGDAVGEDGGEAAEAGEDPGAASSEKPEEDCDCQALKKVIEEKERLIAEKEKLEKLEQEKKKSEKKIALGTAAKDKKKQQAVKTDKAAKKAKVKDGKKEPEKAKKTARDNIEYGSEEKAAKRSPDVSDPRYVKTLHKSMENYFGGEQAKYLRGKINRALISYSYRNDRESALLLRVYERKYRASAETLRAFMRRGLDHPGSLGALVRGFRNEFESGELQIFAFSEFFALKRWQAEALFRLSDSEGL